MDREAVKQILLDSHWFQDLPDQVIEQMISDAKLKSYTDGQYLYSKGDEADGLYAILQGAVVAEINSKEGKCAVLGILEKGSWLGEISVFDDHPRPSDAVARGNAQLLFIPRDKFQGLLDAQPQLYSHFMNQVCKRYRSALRMLEASLIRSLPERLALRLLDLATGYSEYRVGVAGVTLSVSQEELALLAGTTRQRINQELKIWEKAGWVSLGYGSLTIHDCEALENLLSTS
ncbi:Crp/Fnr family transcriptional regulator [Microbulbifer sp. YPW1]|uniref:Crp/Fnr family transcriptional regulator n=1 Tax=Microbulbifer sp. YPW1 TaxID=2745199 RepID=UPI00159A0D33|nr:Crp/Fnr family transcriptional regulator [Microbulbifer sp. YPW1]QKX16373.1 Crp/Fnr family transcriptional regulator [Microbulbifer sp. YPW1]